MLPVPFQPVPVRQEMAEGRGFQIELQAVRDGVQETITRPLPGRFSERCSIVEQATAAAGLAGVVGSAAGFAPGVPSGLPSPDGFASPAGLCPVTAARRTRRGIREWEGKRATSSKRE